MARAAPDELAAFGQSLVGEDTERQDEAGGESDDYPAHA
jgi:hypothetical protein